ncbi:hypothetical protein ACK4PD_14640 [Proteus mirabilis]|uniref:hypothetical protein n=1 Tax=Proteus mirabilis TaxID=584 RepID=UPI00391CF96F
MIKLPKHIKALRIVSLDQVALAMAGLIDDVESVEQAVNGNYANHSVASTYREVIIQAIKLKEINPFEVFIEKVNHSGADYDSYEHIPNGTPMLINNDKIKMCTPISDATFYAKDIWSWVENELNDEANNLSESDNELVKNKILSDNNEIGTWEVFSNKDNKLMFIAGLAIALGKSSSKYKNGSKLNKSRIAEVAIKAINDYGHGTGISDKTLRIYITQALDMHAKKLGKN